MRPQHLVKVLAIPFVLGWPSSNLLAQRAERAGARPNIVLILMDDLGYGDIGSYGVKDAKTPNLDRLAREGVRLTDAYANGPNCSPTRAGLITGQYQQRYGIEWPLGSVPPTPAARDSHKVAVTKPTKSKQTGRCRQKQPSPTTTVA